MFPDPAPSKEKVVKVYIGKADDQVVATDEPPPTDKIAPKRGKLYLLFYSFMM